MSNYILRECFISREKIEDTMIFEASIVLLSIKYIWEHNCFKIRYHENTAISNTSILNIKLIKIGELVPSFKMPNIFLDKPESASKCAYNYLTYVILDGEDYSIFYRIQRKLK